MDEGESLSARSQQLAQVRSLHGEFNSFPGWVGPDANSPYAGERERWTLRRIVKPIDFSIKARNKKLAVIVSPILQGTSSLSGWTNNHPHLRIIDSASWSGKLLSFASSTGLQLPRDDLDGSVPGKYAASHAEAKLLAVYMDLLTNHPEMLQVLREVAGWNHNVLDIDVSAAVCDGCQLISRQMYEKHDLLVNFTSQGQICYPKCKNFKCAAEMRDGLRIFCAKCQIRLTSLQATCINLPRKSAEELHAVIEEAVKNLSLCTRDKSLIRHIVNVTSSNPHLGLICFSYLEVS